MSETIKSPDNCIRLEETFCELGISGEHKTAALSILRPLKESDSIHQECYQHCLRVGFLARQIGAVMHLDQKALFYAGIFHDVGKQTIDSKLLGKTDPWTKEDKEEIKKHVLASYELVKDKFDFSAEIILFHHYFQPDPYPKEFPPFLHLYSNGTQTAILNYARIIAIADTYDALHRQNSYLVNNRQLTDQEIEDQMLLRNPDKKSLIEDLYHLGIFKNNQKKVETDRQKQLYDGLWESFNPNSPREIGRRVMLATALEPVSDKNGNTTRFTDISRFLTLKDFIVSGINIGQSFEDLALRIQTTNTQPKVIYDLALKAQQDSVKNRSNGRVNQGIIEILLPIVTAEQLSVVQPVSTDIFDNATKVLKQTSSQDVDYLIEMKKYANELSSYTDRVVPVYPNTPTVFDYYNQDFHFSNKVTSLAHNGEFVNGFPTVRLIYNHFCENSSLSFSEIITSGYRKALSYHDPNIGRGFIADCIAVATYIYLSTNPKNKFFK